MKGNNSELNLDSDSGIRIIVVADGRSLDVIMSMSLNVKGVSRLNVTFFDNSGGSREETVRMLPALC